MIVHFNGFGQPWRDNWFMSILDKIDHKNWVGDRSEPKLDWAVEDLKFLGYNAWIESGEPVDKILVEIPDKEYTFLVLKYS